MTTIVLDKRAITNIGMVHRGCNGYGSCGGAKLWLVQYKMHAITKKQVWRC